MRKIKDFKEEELEDLKKMPKKKEIKKEIDINFDFNESSVFKVCEFKLFLIKNRLKIKINYYKL